MDDLRNHGLIGGRKSQSGEIVISHQNIQDSGGASQVGIVDSPDHVIGYSVGLSIGNITVVDKKTGAKTIYTLPYSPQGYRIRVENANWWGNGECIVFYGCTLEQGYFYMFLVFFYPNIGIFEIKYVSPQGTVRRTVLTVIDGDEFYLTHGNNSQYGSSGLNKNIYKTTLSHTEPISDFQYVINTNEIIYFVPGQPVISNGFIYSVIRNGSILKFSLLTGAGTVLHFVENGTLDRALCGGTKKIFYAVDPNTYTLREVDLTNDAVTVSKAFSNYAFHTGAIGNGYDGKSIVSWRNYVYGKTTSVYIETPLLTKVGE